ncbi:MAG: hypothetical protein LIP11_07555, partial [Clostridiales bacterium]|nr:hypothetical protein [Clostridiales bacterium]
SLPACHHNVESTRSIDDSFYLGIRYDVCWDCNESCREAGDGRKEKTGRETGSLLGSHPESFGKERPGKTVNLLRRGCLLECFTGLLKAAFVCTDGYDF